MTTHAPTSLTQDQQALTRRVLDSFDNAESPRVREILQSLVRHLHAFATEVGLTEQEWATGVEVLTRVGQVSDQTRQEAILLSDVLGLSMLVVGINHPVGERATASTVFGPFFTSDAPAFSNGDDISGGARGAPCAYAGRVTSTDGTPLPGAHLEIWHADEDGNYDVQYPGLDHRQGRGQLDTDTDGRYHFWSVLPEPYPIPDDGPVGDLLAASRRSPMRPAHVHFMISAPGHRTLTTHVFRAGDPHLGSDAVFGEQDSLVASFDPHQPGAGPDGRPMPRDFHTMTFDFVLDRDDPASGAR